MNVHESIRELEAEALTKFRLGIEEPVVGIAVCQNCLERFMPAEFKREEAVPRFCGQACEDAYARKDTGPRTVVIGGQAYEVDSIGAHPLTEWKDCGLPQGSSLSGGEFNLQVKR